MLSDVLFIVNSVCESVKEIHLSVLNTVYCNNNSTMDTDRSLGSGLSFPQWMKSRMIDNRLDLDQSAFSPPDQDDSFLFIRYPRKSRDDGRRPSAEKNILAPKTIVAEVPDPSKHPAACRPFITGVGPQPAGKQLKSSGTDDGFKGKAAACGTSIVKVAHQMVSEQRQQQQLEVQQVDFPAGFNASVRRGSRSLPVSPSTSPKSNRKLLNYNKYFTGAFTEGEKGSWILAGLLGKRDTICRSVTTVSEENSGSVPDLTVEDDVKMKKSATKQVFKAKPSELREMNFWSPTSM